MTDKEQIIIDGVDVRNCDSFIDYYMVDETQFQDVSEDIIEQDKLPVVYKGLPDCLLRKNLCGAYTCHCKDKPNCYFKQLARKTQALNEIEKVCLEDACILADGTVLRYDTLDDILDIIHKAKGGVYE